MNWRIYARWSLVIMIATAFVVSTGCGRWRYRDKHVEVEIEHDDHDGHHHKHHPHHPHGGPPGQMKKHDKHHDHNNH